MTEPWRLTDAQTFSISAENPTGAPGGGGRATAGVHSTAYASSDLPVGWKKSPCIDLGPRETRVIAEIEGPGIIQHLWLTTLPAHWRSIVLRFTWDDADAPSIAVPLGDFFCQGWARYAPVTSQVITVAPAGGLNSYWPMPFARAAVVSVENLTDATIEGVFFQLTWSATAIDPDAGRLHAQWRRSDPLEFAVPHTIVDGVEGRGAYVGTYLAWEAHHAGWWGEGEVKFYLDDDEEFPTICGTGTEDYVGGAWAFEHPAGHYAPYSSPYLGMPQVIEPDGFYANQQRFGLYRWHLPDPIRFRRRCRATVAALGFYDRPAGQERYRPLRDDVASVGWFYLDHATGVEAGGTPLTREALDLA